MNSQTERLIDVAKQYIGVKESPPNSNNVLFNTAYYGYPVSGSAYPWCMTYIWYVFGEAELSKLFYDGGKTASCTTLMNWSKKQGRFYTSGYERGDVVFFDFDDDSSKSEHAGIITELTCRGVETIEGNTAIGSNSDGGEVMRRTRAYNTVIGVYKPEYAADENKMTQDDFNRMMAVYLKEQSMIGVNQNTAPEEYEEAVAAGITDGSRPQSFATRQEVAIMANRVLSMINNT